MPSINPGSPGQDDSSTQDDSPFQPTGAQEQAAKFFLASIVESSQDSIVTIDFDGIITTWNKAAERVCGYRADEALGKPLTMLTLPEDLTGILDKIETVSMN